MEVIATSDLEDIGGTKVAEMREQQIVKLMAEAGLKEEVAHLFRKMSVMPAARRMSVMPGVKYEDSSDQKKVNIVKLKFERCDCCLSFLIVS